ncbi:MAG: TIGR03084 family metal-binding protein [Rhodopila sp.]
MLQQIADFKAEVEDLNALLMTLSETDWTKETLFKSWTVNNVVQHLHGGDLMAAASAAGPDAFARHRAESQALRDSGLSRLEATRRQMGDLTGFRLRRAWHAQVLALCEKLAAMPAEARLKWSGPDMGLRMFATARQMETWAHGQEIFDVMGAERRPTDRLRNIAEIGVRTYGWTFANRGLAAPGPAPHVRLTAPSGAVWTWNDPASDNCIEGFALEFCQVVTQVRNITDTALTVTGTPARDWMRVAQCFAGPPEDPPAPGSRYANRREA